MFAYEWQTKGLRDRESVRVANKGLTNGVFCAFAHDGRELWLARDSRRWGRGMPPPVFLQKSPQTIENKGRGYEKETQESSRAGKYKEVKEIAEVRQMRSVKLFRDGEGRDW